MLGVWMAMGIALAQNTEDLDVDPALVWPAAGCESIGAVEAVARETSAECGGVRIEVQSRPVMEGDRSHVGARIQLAPHVGIQRGAFRVFGVLPVLSHFNSELGQEHRVGFGDPRIGVGARLLNEPAARLGTRLDLRLPIGTSESWMGERGLRARLSGLAEVGGEKHRGLLDLGLVLRSQALPRPLSSVPWVTGSIAWRASWTERIETQLALHARPALGTSDQVAQHPVGMRGSVRVGRMTGVEIGGGTAVLRGLGSSEFTLTVGVHTRSQPREVASEPTARNDEPPPSPIPEACLPEDVDCLPDGPTDAAPAPPESPEAPAQEEDVQVAIASILLQTLQFELGTAELLSESKPVLRQLANDLLGQPTVGPILLEGHASQEGAFADNYALSLARADAVYRRLVDMGVSPSRLVLRPLGEVQDDALPDLASRRRVEVRLVLDPLFADDVVVHPFTGQEIKP